MDERTPSLSVVILTFNEEANLPDCLASLSGLDCDVFIVDSGSTDRTLEIASREASAVLYHPFENYALQRNWAQQNLPIRSDWVLHLDADERLTPELVQEINSILKSPAPTIDGYLFRKRTIFMGRWIRHGGHYPSFHLRLFKAKKGFCEDRLYDQHFIVRGKTRALENDYEDVVSSNVLTWSTRHLRWASLEAREISGCVSSPDTVQAELLGNPIERRRWLRNDLYGRVPLFWRAFLYWIYRYFLRLGFLDGKEGLIFHFLQGCWFRFVVDSLILESRVNGSPAGQRKPSS